MYVEMDTDLAEHPKTKRLKRMLKISSPACVGSLQLLWSWVMKFAPNGDLTDYAPEDIADACDWEGDAQELVSALIDCRVGEKKHGYLERTADGRLLVHDWHQYGGRLIVKRFVDAFRKRENRPPTEAEMRSAGLPLPPPSEVVIASAGTPLEVAPTAPVDKTSVAKRSADKRSEPYPRQDKQTGEESARGEPEPSPPDLSSVVVKEKSDFVGRTLTEHPHWSAPLEKIVSAKRPDNPGGYRAATLRRWLDGDGTPPDPSSPPVRAIGAGTFGTPDDTRKAQRDHLRDIPGDDWPDLEAAAKKRLNLASYSSDTLCAAMRRLWCARQKAPQIPCDGDGANPVPE